MAGGGTVREKPCLVAYARASPCPLSRWQEASEMRNSLHRLLRQLHWNRAASWLLARRRSATKGCPGLGWHIEDARSQSVLAARAASCIRKREDQPEVRMLSQPEVEV